MSASYKTTGGVTEKEHVSCALPLVPGNGNGASKDAKCTGVAKKIPNVAIGIHSVLILALFGISTYHFHMSRTKEYTVNGNWSQWGAWSTCSLTCGSGVTIRFRRCDSPAPSSAGRYCTGDPMEADSCGVARCPGHVSTSGPAVNGSWTQWGAWSTCSLTCGSGVTTRFRRCDSPAPSSTGTDCTGNPMEADSCEVSRCPEPVVNGSWSQWGAWSTCSLTCGSGVTTRFRRCDSPAPSSIGRDCTGDPMEADFCNITRCPETVVNGSWSQWGAWSTCSLTCGSGVTTRFRRCDSPAPSSTGRHCTGDPLETDSCEVARCPEHAVDGMWSQWGAWSTCSLTCGSGVTTRFRRCDSPAPSSTGRHCTGDPLETDSCEVAQCPEPGVNGSWSEWGAWNTCSLTCGSGVTTRFRRCDSPAPSSTGTDCTGDPMETDSCEVARCPEPVVNGGWSQWGTWSTCSLTCGSGVTTRFRRCDSPAPSSTGRHCTGDPLETESCELARCPEPIVYGGWSQWGAWSTCSLTCGSGVTTRFRRCDSPAPSSTGTECTGDPLDADSCEVTRCPDNGDTPASEPEVNGSWSQWGAWSTCSLTCGSGVTTRFRRCDSPVPSSAGRDCTGDPLEADSCEVARCPEPVVNGSWSQWGAWSTCSLTCGSGVTTRFRRCDSPAPSSAGRDCTGDPMEADFCNITRCEEPVLNGSWSLWGAWSTCSLTCGSGVTTRFRRCDSPAPSSTGKDCTGDPMEADSCNMTRCEEPPVNGSWSQWGAWSTCSLTCGSGVTTRFRRCDSPAPSSTGRDCTGNPMEADSCNITRCEDTTVNGSWSQWGAWSTCSLTCGSGVTTRFRRCDSPAPSSTGTDCVGDPLETDSCVRSRCPERSVNGRWSPWSRWNTCSLTCGSGVTTRFRRCDRPAPSSTGRACTGNPMEADSCQVRRCSEKQSAFTATTPTGGVNLRFTRVITNIGYDYSAYRGRFTCQYPGTYYFAISIVKLRHGGPDRVSVHIRVNGNIKVTGLTDPQDDSDDGSYETSAMLTTRLSAGDYVDTQSDFGHGAQHMERTSHFSGFLVQAD